MVTLPAGFAWIIEPFLSCFAWSPGCLYAHTDPQSWSSLLLVLVQHLYKTGAQGAWANPIQTLHQVRDGLCMAEFRWLGSKAHEVSTLPDHPALPWDFPPLDPTLIEPHIAQDLSLPGHSYKFNQKNACNLKPTGEVLLHPPICPPNNVSDTGSFIHSFTHAPNTECQLGARQSARSWGYRHGPCLPSWSSRFRGENLRQVI